MPVKKRKEFSKDTPSSKDTTTTTTRPTTTTTAASSILFKKVKVSSRIPTTSSTSVTPPANPKTIDSSTNDDDNDALSLLTTSIPLTTIEYYPEFARELFTIQLTQLKDGLCQLQVRCSENSHWSHYNFTIPAFHPMKLARLMAWKKTTMYDLQPQSCDEINTNVVDRDSIRDHPHSQKEKTITTTTADEIDDDETNSDSDQESVRHRHSRSQKKTAATATTAAAAAAPVDTKKKKKKKKNKSAVLPHVQLWMGGQIIIGKTLETSEKVTKRTVEKKLSRSQQTILTNSHTETSTVFIPASQVHPLFPSSKRVQPVIKIHLPESIWKPDLLPSSDEHSEVASDVDVDKHDRLNHPHDHKQFVYVLMATTCGYSPEEEDKVEISVFQNELSAYRTAIFRWLCGSEQNLAQHGGFVWKWRRDTSDNEHENLDQQYMNATWQWKQVLNHPRLEFLNDLLVDDTLQYKASILSEIGKLKDIRILHNIYKLLRQYDSSIPGISKHSKRYGTDYVVYCRLVQTTPPYLL